MNRLPDIKLNDGQLLPAVGLGTYPNKGDDAAAVVASGIGIGYRLIDTALRYENEAGVGEGIRRSGLDRGEIVVTSKLPGRFHGYDSAWVAVQESLHNLGLDRIDLYLIHWPLPRQGKYVDTWKALVELQREGLVGSIGVSNFTEEHLTRLIDATGVTPAVNQIEMHPLFPQAELRAAHARLGIVTESWSPLGRGTGVLESDTIREIAAAHEVSPAQAVLRWHTQLGSVPIPMSTNPDRQRQNLEIGGFELSDAELARISGLEQGRIWGQDPDEHEEF
ncbi:MAG: aldo/keto reductase [Leucobacter sp.]